MKSFQRRVGQPPLPGKLVFHLDELAQKRGIVVDFGNYEGKTNLSALQRGTSLAYSTIFPWVRDPEQMKAISVDTLIRLCDFLQCQPGELLEYRPYRKVESRKLDKWYEDHVSPEERARMDTDDTISQF